MTEQVYADKSELAFSLSELEERDGHTMHSIPELRRLTKIPKGRFDRALWSMAEEQSVRLHFHDFPASLTSAKRSELLRDRAGRTYQDSKEVLHYIGVSVR